jgi:hypothetical protein
MSTREKPGVLVSGPTSVLRFIEMLGGNFSVTQTGELKQNHDQAYPRI